MSRITDRLTNDLKAGMFRMLEKKNLYDVGVEYGLDKQYKSVDSMKGAVYRIYREVGADLEKFGLSQETKERVEEAMEHRSVATNSKDTTVAEKEFELRKVDLDVLLTANRDLSAKLINRKLVELNNSRKQLRNESIVNLGKIFGILFDKSQIIKGAATEHIAVMSKIDDNINPKDAIEMVLNMRERLINKD